MNSIIRTALIFLAVLVVYEIAVKRVVLKAAFDEEYDYEEYDDDEV